MTQNGFNPQDHLVKIKAKDGSIKDYYPAAWRLYELSLKYPNANFSSDVLFFDIEKNTCLVKVRLYLGADYAQSDKKAEAHKSGPYTSLDKVETAAMARAARNFGIGTEYALEFEQEDSAPNTKQRLNSLYARGKATCHWTDLAGFLDYAGAILETPLTKQSLYSLSDELIVQLEQSL